MELIKVFAKSTPLPPLIVNMANAALNQQDLA